MASTASGSGRLAGKRAVVVGAGQTAGETMGNGRAVAITFAREGARLLLVDRDEHSVEETRAMVVDAGGEAEVFVADIKRDESAAAIAARAVDVLGGVDVLHNNVGIGAGDARATKLAPDAWDRIFSVNLRGMWLTCREVIPIMVDGGGGAIVNISSLAAVAAATGLTAYKISKAGVNALTHALAVDHVADGVRVNAIMPGFIDTPMAVDAPARAMGRPRDGYAAARSKVVPMGHQGTAWDVANAALFLASDEAAFITGVVLPVDGGQGARIG